MKNNKQQTTVEWLEQQIKLRGITHYFSIRELIEQAKEMEKQQIRKAYCDGEHYKDTKLTTDYYNETYGGGEQ